MSARRRDFLLLAALAVAVAPPAFGQTVAPAVAPAAGGAQSAAVCLWDAELQSGRMGVVPAKAGTQWRSFKRHWIPAFAGMTSVGSRGRRIKAAANARDVPFRGNDECGIAWQTTTYTDDP